MMPQLTPQQAQAAISDMQERIQAKTLECVSLKQLLDTPIELVEGLNLAEHRTHLAPALQEAVNNFLTAKYNQAIVDLRTLELQLKMYQNIAERIDSHIVVPTFQKP